MCIMHMFINIDFVLASLMRLRGASAYAWRCIVNALLLPMHHGCKVVDIDIDIVCITSEMN